MSPWSVEGAVLGGVTVVLVSFSFAVGDLVCDLVGNGLLSLDANYLQPLYLWLILTTMGFTKKNSKST